MLRKGSLLLLLPVVFLLFLAVDEKGRQAEAAPIGAATGQFVAQQFCQADGLVTVRFVWAPSGWGSQWVDVTKLNNNFAFGFVGIGPLPPNQNVLDWIGLEPNTVYYSRVNTFTQFGWLTSDTIGFVTIACGTGFTPPHNLRDTVLGPNSARLSWDRGVNNLFFCVDTALSQNDLLTFSGTWRNWGCGTTAETITLTQLACDATHYWRVWAAGPGVSGHSGIDTFRTANCAFSPPTNPRTSNVTATSARFHWDSGADNAFFCLDLATSQSDLTSLSGSWRNFGCGTTATQLDISTLACNTTYYWRVWARSSGTATGYSPIASFTTLACAFSPPTNLVADDIEKTEAELSWTPGNNNEFFCVDIAKSQTDLLRFGPTWQNKCGTATEVLITGLDCDTTYWWRVYAVGDTTSGYSEIKTFKTDAC